MIKSPIFYMGNKVDLMQNLLRHFPSPEHVNRFYDVFGGSGAVSINVGYKNRFYSEKDAQVAKMLVKIKETPYEKIINHIEGRIKEFNLPSGDTSGRELRQSKEGEEGYLRFRAYVNERRAAGDDVTLDDYCLSFFSFCNLMRYNKSGAFNMPYGKRAFSTKDRGRIYEGKKALEGIQIRCACAFDVLASSEIQPGDFIYLDPPYTNTLAIYQDGGGWGIAEDLRLFEALDALNVRGVRWALSNVSVSRGKVNQHLLDWASSKGYSIIEFEDKKYASLAKGNSGAIEVLIVNYDTPRQLSLFDIDFDIHI